MARSPVPDDAPHMLGLGIQDSWCAEIDIRKNTEVRLRFEVHDVDRPDTDGVIHFVDTDVRRPFADGELEVGTAFFTLFCTVKCLTTPRARTARRGVMGTRANLGSSVFSPVLALTKRKLRAVLFAPKTEQGTEATALNKSA